MGPTLSCFILGRFSCAGRVKTQKVKTVSQTIIDLHQRFHNIAREIFTNIYSKHPLRRTLRRRKSRHIKPRQPRICQTSPPSKCFPSTDHHNSLPAQGHHLPGLSHLYQSRVLLPHIQQNHPVQSFDLALIRPARSHPQNISWNNLNHYNHKALESELPSVSKQPYISPTHM
jgi:hypothetical protein